MTIETITRITLDPVKKQTIITTMEHSDRVRKVGETTSAIVFERRDRCFTEPKEGSK